MRFDDRLSTVLRKPVTGAVIARIQYRQLLDLLGTSPSEANGPQIDAAYLRLGQLASAIPDGERAAVLGEPMLRLRNPRLVAELAAGEPVVAGAAIAAAQLGEEQWLDLIPALPVSARGHLRHRRGLGPQIDALLERLGINHRGLPPAADPMAEQPMAAAPIAEAPMAASDTAPLEETGARPGERVADPAPEPIHASAPPAEVPAPLARPAVAAAAVEPAPPAAPAPIRAETRPQDEPIEGIGAIVRRIEQFRRTRQLREAEVHGPDAPRLPLDDLQELPAPPPCDSFDFATDTEGRIVWADAAIAPMAIGLRLAARDPESPVHASEGFNEAFRQRQPIRAELLRIIGAPAVTGFWQADAAPRFDQPGGRFLGYGGRMRRPAAATAVPRPEPESEADRMRQVLHELRTPVNAIQGFAEVIQQQLFGPTPHEYRALAATIASDGARMLAGFEELDRLVRLDGGALSLESGACDLAAIVGMTVAQLQPYTDKRESGFALEQEGTVPAAMERSEAERLVWRLLATLAGAAAPGEVLRLRTRLRQDAVRGTRARIIVQLPASLAARDDHALFHATAPGQQQQALSVGMFGTGFALRLTAAEARAAGGSLERKGEKIRLSLPGLTRAATGHSQTHSSNAHGAAAANPDGG